MAVAAVHRSKENSAGQASHVRSWVSSAFFNIASAIQHETESRVFGFNANPILTLVI